MSKLLAWLKAIWAAIWTTFTLECPDCNGTGEGVSMNYDFPCEMCGGKGRVSKL